MTERGDRIRQLRHDRGMGATRLADQLGVSTRTIRNWEAGENIAFPNLVALAQALDTSPDYIEDGTIGEAPPGDDRLALLEARMRCHEADTRARLRALEAEVAELRRRVREEERV